MNLTSVLLPLENKLTDFVLFIQDKILLTIAIEVFLKVFHLRMILRLALQPVHVSLGFGAEEERTVPGRV